MPAAWATPGLRADPGLGQAIAAAAQVELCLLLAIDEQEPASAEYLASLARLRDSGVRIALHPQRIDTDARQCFAEVDAGLCDYLGLDARLLAPAR